MKRILILLAFLIGSAVTASAQTDIKKLDKVGETAILKVLGNPSEKWELTDMDHYPRLGSATKDGYGPSKCEIVIHPKSKELIFFDTESPKYCVLSDIVPGGIKVGTKMSTLKKYSFYKTKYGRNKPANELTLDPETASFSEKTYVIYGKEYKRIVLFVKNDVVTGWQFYTAENDYEMRYDKSVDIF